MLVDVYKYFVGVMCERMHIYVERLQHSSAGKNQCSCLLNGRSRHQEYAADRNSQPRDSRQPCRQVFF